MIKNHIHHHNVLKNWPFPDKSVDCIVTSPPYWGLRDYGTAKWEGGDPHCNHADAKIKTRFDYSLANSPKQASSPGTDAAVGMYKKECPTCGAKNVDQQIGQEKTPEEYVEHMVQVFTEASRVLKDTGTLWLNLGDTYWGGKGQSGGARTDVKNCELSLNADGINYLTKGQTRPQDRRHPDIKPKDIVGIPWMVAFALRSAGWYLRSEIIWAKPNCMPESVTDRPTRSHETIFLLTKQRDYYYDAEAIKEALAASSISRLQQDVQNQVGTTRHVGKTNGNFKAQGDLTAGNRNKRDVWTVPPGSFDGEYCTACGRYFDGPAKRLIQETKIEDGDNPPRIEKRCTCGQTNAWLSHFATFPPDLITDCIKAGSSQHGNCAACGSPWERQVESIRYRRDELQPGDPRYRPNRYEGAYGEINGKGDAGYTETKTIGWQPTCSCGTTKITPAIILDPFMGSGTTALTARELGRDFVGMDLNEHYIAMARARLRAGQQAHIQF